jgi:hypothetical protein
VDLVCGSAGYLSAGTRTREARMSRSERRRARRRRSRVGVQIRVTVPFSTLFGIDEQPGELAGNGTITAKQARELAAQGTWRRILTDPATGAPTDYGITVYRPPAALRDLVVSRTPICGFPSCLRPAHRGDLDHREPHNPVADTGPTNERNLDAYCRRHHRTKHTPGWSVHQDDHGTLTWTSPSGPTWPQEPPPITEPAAQPPDPDKPPPF